jgi:hypothetical protein
MEEGVRPFNVEMKYALLLGIAHKAMRTAGIGTSGSFGVANIAWPMTENGPIAACRALEKMI